MKLFMMSALILCVGMAVADGQKSPPIACNMKAISAAQRPHYDDLMKKLRGSIRGRTELADGFAYGLDPKGITLQELGDWMTMERLCCPFLTFNLEVKNDGATQLSMRGPEGTKLVLKEDFSAK